MQQNFVAVGLLLVFDNVIVADPELPCAGQKTSARCYIQTVVVYTVSVHLEEHLMTPGWSLFDLQDLKFFRPLYLADY